MPENLSETLIEIRRQRRNQIVINLAARLMTVNLTCLLVAIAADNLAGLSFHTRLIILAVFTSANLAAMTLITAITLRHKLSARQTAILIEKEFNIRDNSLVNAVCFNSDPTLPEELKNAFNSHADSLCANIHITPARKTPECRHPLRLMLIAFLIPATYLAIFPRYTLNAAIRLLNPWTQLAAVNKTQFKVSPGDCAVNEGDSLNIEAEAIRNDQVPHKLNIAIRGGDSATFHPMTRHQNKNTFSVDNIRANFHYSISAGNDSSREFSVKVIPEPRFASLQTTITPPAYTRLSPQSFPHEQQNFQCPPGSNVLVTFTPPAGYSTIPPQDPTFKLSANTLAFKIHQDMKLSLGLRHNSGKTHQNSWQAAFSVTPDKAPVIRFLNRKLNIEAGMGQDIPIHFSASDDFGISSIKAHLIVNNTESLIREFSYQDNPKNLRETFNLRITPELLPPNSSAQIRLTAADNHPPPLSSVTNPNITIHIVDLGSRLRQSTDDPGQRKLYELLFDILARQQEARQWLSSHTHNFRPWEGQRLLRAQQDNTQKLTRAATDARVTIPNPSLANAIDFLATSPATLLCKRAETIAIPNPDSARTRLVINEVITVQSDLIARLQTLLNHIANAREQEIKKQQLGEISQHEKELFERLRQLHRKLDEFTTAQRIIIEKTEAVDRKDVEDWSDAEEKLLGDLAAKQSEWAKFFKAAFNDLSKLQNQDFSNSAMANEFIEMYEELQKAGKALEKKQIEIATLAENTALESALNVVTNLDRWLSDSKDHIKWTAEEDGSSPDTPLPDLPEELTDIIGDLIETEDDMAEDTQDSTNSFTYSSDLGLGWGVSDGNIDSMQAKGITGNVLPNNNEVGGRSGEGRSGKSSGQFVEKEATGKGGRKTPTRLTHSPFEKGSVDDKSKDPQGGASGGGKQSGTGDEGLIGNTPDQDPDVNSRLAGQHGELRQRAMTVLGQLSERQLPTADLRRAIDKLSAIEQTPPGQGGVDARRAKREIAAALQDAVNSIRAASQSNSEKLREQRGKTYIIKYQHNEKIPEPYEDYVKQYFKALAGDEQ